MAILLARMSLFWNNSCSVEHTIYSKTIASPTHSGEECHFMEKEDVGRGCLEAQSPGGKHEWRAKDVDGFSLPELLG